MPNWCYNLLYVIPQGETGKEEFAAFERDNVVEGEDGSPQLTFRHILPPPDERILDTADGYNGRIEGLPDGHSWAIETWGTKWGPRETVRLAPDRHEMRYPARGTVAIEFETAWSPPKPVVLAWAKKYPHLLFALHYEEGGNLFIGDMEVLDGSVRVDAERRGRELSLHEMLNCRGG